MFRPAQIFSANVPLNNNTTKGDLRCRSRVLAVVKAHASAEHLMRDYEFGQSEEDRYNGWRYFLEETDLAPGMNADEATKLRQVRLERRESGALTTPQ
ncbi:MAG: hypothetical protein DMG97_04275 [Acidobacteria bacterium]|nr:MAG: hypothetical protein DMG97_04275 [Acidobacteriota bacterium]